MNDAVHITTENAWRAWKKACAAGLCDADSAAALRRFGSARFTTYIKRYAASAGHYGQAMIATDRDDGWHLLETHARVGTNRAGKRYKDWLFTRADASGDDWLAAVEASATLLMRNVVRETLRHEYAPAFMTSLHKPIARNEGYSLTLEDLLPDTLDPHDEMAAREWSDLAQKHAAGFFPTLNFRERVVLWGRARGVALSDPRLLSWTQCSPSLLYKVHGDALQQLGAMITKNHPDEPPSVKTHLAVLTLAELEKIISAKIFVEKGAARFFKTTGSTPAEQPPGRL